MYKENFMELKEALETLENAGYLVNESIKDELDDYESKFTVGIGPASNKIIQWSTYNAGALVGNEKFYPKRVVEKLIKEYENEIQSLKEQIKELEHELNSMDLER